MHTVQSPPNTKLSGTPDGAAAEPQAAAPGMAGRARAFLRLNGRKLWWLHSMYALGLLMRLVLGWSFTVSVLVSAAIVLVYTYLGGLSSAIYNEVLQFFLIVLGFAPLSILAVMKAGGWDGLKTRLPAAMTPATP